MKTAKTKKSAVVAPAPRPAKYIDPRLLLLVLAAFLVFFPAVTGRFISDDTDGIQNNMLLRSCHGLLKIWSTPYTSEGRESGYWPMTYTTFWIEHQIWGTNTIPYHIDNFLLHTLNVILVWFLLRGFIGNAAWLAAMFFAVHPIHVESVAWISERKDVLSTFFYLLAFLAYIRFEEKAEWKNYFLSVGCFLFAMLSKSAVVTFPVVLLLWLWWSGRKISLKSFFPLVPFFAISLTLSLVGMSIEQNMRPEGYGLTPVLRILLVGRALWFYAAKIFMPIGLTCVYPKWHLDASSVWQFFYPLAAIGLLVVLWRMRHRVGKGPLVATLFFGVTLTPVLGIIDFGLYDYTYVAERYVYLASIGIFALVSACVVKYAERAKLTSHPGYNATISVVVFVLALQTWCYSAVYKNEETVSRHVIARDPFSSKGHFDLGCALRDKGDREGAITSLKKALQLRPDYAYCLSNIGQIQSFLGRNDEAVETYKKALLMKQDDFVSIVGLSMALSKTEDMSGAFDYAKRAIALKPNHAAAHAMLASLYAHQKMYKEALPELTKALELGGEDAGLLWNTAFAYHSVGDGDNAIEFCLRTLERDKNMAEPHSMLGYIYRQRKQWAESVKYYESLVRLQPTNPDAHGNLASAYLNNGQPEKALLEYRAGLRLAPDSVGILNELTSILSTEASDSIRNGKEAVAYGESALKLTEGKNTSTLDSLAAAYAETGRFEDAVRTAERAMQLANASGEEGLANGIAERIDLYKQRKPYRVR